jgi:hypothetical protein
MVQLQENQLVITIPTPSPAETLADMQHGIIEIVKTILAQGREGKDLLLDRPTADGGYFALELLQATLMEAGGKKASLEKP